MNNEDIITTHTEVKSKVPDDRIDEMYLEDGMEEENEEVLKVKINSDGFIIEHVLTSDEDTDTLLSVRVPDGMFKPQWNGTYWVETDTAAKQANNINRATEDLLKEVHNYLDSIAKANGFTGDSTTRPYRAIANYVGYDNYYRESAESLGKWISGVFVAIEKIYEDVMKGTRKLPTKEELLSELEPYTPVK